MRRATFTIEKWWDTEKIGEDGIIVLEEGLNSRAVR